MNITHQKNKSSLLDIIKKIKLDYPINIHINYSINANKKWLLRCLDKTWENINLII